MWKDIITKHGFNTLENRKKGYSSWLAMKARCLYPKHPAFKNYGGRGITITPSWLGDSGFENFIKDMGPRPNLKYTLDRIDPNGNYEPSNCRWATWKEQGRHKRTVTSSENYDEHNKWNKKFHAVLQNAIRTFKKSGKCSSPQFERLIGISFSEFVIYFESLFTLGMTWYNRGRVHGHWQIDCIIPVNQFDLSKEEDRKKCFNYTNLQPLWYDAHEEKVRTDYKTYCNI